MTVIGIVGLPGSGKSEAAAVAAEMGIPVVTMGDVIRAECRDRGLDPATHHGEIASALREENGPDAIARRSLPMIRDWLDEADTVLVDGIRGGVEVDRFREAFGDDFLLVAIDAPFDLRATRIADRGRDDTSDDGEALRERDERELGFGMGEAIERADATIVNAASLDEFHGRIRALLSGGLAGLDRAGESR